MGAIFGLCLAVLVTDCADRDGSPTGPSLVLHDSLQGAPVTELVPFSTSVSRRPDTYDLALDDFVSPATGSVRSLRWLGVYCENLREGARLPNGGAEAFNITFHSEVAGVVDVNRPALSSGNYTIAQVNERFVDSANLLCNGPRVPAALYEYSLTLDQPVSVAQGTRYWVGIHALIADSPSERFGDEPCNRCVIWGWRRSAVTTNGYGVNTRFSNAVIPFDFAFRVSQ